MDNSKLMKDMLLEFNTEYNLGINENDLIIDDEEQLDQQIDQEIVDERIIDEHIEKIKEINLMDKPARIYVKLDDTEMPNGISGIHNIGNTCYMNSILQCIINMPILKEKLLNISNIKELYKFIIKDVQLEDKKNYTKIVSKITNTITFQLYKILKNIWEYNIKHITPIDFKKIFANKIDNFKNYDQQDAQEALLCILDTIHIETESNVNISYNMFSEEYLQIFKQFDTDDISDIECCRMESIYPDIWELYSLKRTIDRYNSKSFSFITDSFQNIISSKLECPECNYHSYNFDPTIIISIQIPIDLFVDLDTIDKDIQGINGICDEIRQQIRYQLIQQQSKNSIISLEQCLSKFFNIEILDEDEKWHCPNCDKKIKAKKQTDIWLCSRILVIHLKRFDHFGNKINNLITFPTNDLNINPFMSEYSRQLGTYTYNLISVVNHIGSMNDGHYYSFVKSISDKSWYCINDNDVIKIDESTVNTKDAYILIYELVE
jgi:ubiquitin C-terminal hydrolase